MKHNADNGADRSLRKTPEPGYFYDDHGKLVLGVNPEVYGLDAKNPAAEELGFSTVQIAVVNILLGNDPRPLAKIAESIGCSPQALSAAAATAREKLGFMRTRKKRTK